MSKSKQAGFNPPQPVLKLRVDSYDQQRQADPSVDGLNRVSEHPLLQSTMKDGVRFSVPAVGPGNPSTSDTVRVLHGLGRAYRGWFVTCVTRGDLVVSEVTGGDRKSTELKLRATINPGPGSDETVTVNILVF